LNQQSWESEMTAAIAIVTAAQASAVTSTGAPTSRPWSSSLQVHATDLRDAGFTVLPNALDLALVRSARGECVEALGAMLRQIDASDGERSDDAFSFREIIHRAPKRYDLHEQAGGRHFHALCKQATSQAQQVVAALHRLPLQPDDHDPRFAWTRRLLPRRPRVILDGGAVVSLPGAPAQHFHADCSPMHSALASKLPCHRLYQVFFPLQPIESDTCGTQFWPGSHLSRRRREAPEWDAHGSRRRLVHDADAMAAMSAPAVPEGGLIIFDYRVVHRGLPNAGSRPRPIGHALLSTGYASDRQSYARFPSVWSGTASEREEAFRAKCSDFADAPDVD
jgi:hypothetical protein